MPQLGFTRSARPTRERRPPQSARRPRLMSHWRGVYAERGLAEREPAAVYERASQWAAASLRYSCSRTMSRSRWSACRPPLCTVGGRARIYGYIGRARAKAGPTWASPGIPSAARPEQGSDEEMEKRAALPAQPLCGEARQALRGLRVNSVPSPSAPPHYVIAAGRLVGRSAWRRGS